MSDPVPTPTPDRAQTLAGKRALITGSTSGIGAAIARAFAASGATVTIHGLEHEKGERLAHQLGGHYLAADLTDPTAVDRLAEAALQMGPLHILVNNAGVEQHRMLADLNPDTLQWTMQVNFLAPTRLTQLLLPALRAAQAASVINVTSIHDEVPVYGNLAYCASKAALAMMTRTAALELGREGIRVNAIAPGAVETRHNSEILDAIGREQFSEWIPLGRVGTPPEIADVAVFLASGSSRYVNGHTLVADGGYRHHLVRYPGHESGNPPTLSAAPTCDSERTIDRSR